MIFPFIFCLCNIVRTGVLLTILCNCHSSGFILAPLSLSCNSCKKVKESYCGENWERRWWAPNTILPTTVSHCSNPYKQRILLSVSQDLCELHAYWNSIVLIGNLISKQERSQTVFCTGAKQKNTYT